MIEIPVPKERSWNENRGHESYALLKSSRAILSSDVKV